MNKTVFSTQDGSPFINEDPLTVQSILSKEQANRLHFKRRARQHYGLKFNRNQIEAIVRKIQAEEGLFLYRVSRSRAWWMVLTPQEIPIVVLYCRRHKTPVTCRAMNMQERFMVKTLIDEVRYATLLSAERGRQKLRSGMVGPKPDSFSE